MAQIAIRPHDRVDVLLDYLIDEWERLPEAAREIDRWDLIEQIDYVEEWAPKEDLADELQHQIDSSAPSPAQRARYDELQRLMREHRPILDRLRAT